MKNNILFQNNIINWTWITADLKNDNVQAVSLSHLEKTGLVAVLAVRFFQVAWYWPPTVRQSAGMEDHNNPATHFC